MLTFKVKKLGDGKFKYTCECGSEMWDNTLKKSNPKAPDLKCKSKSCTLGKGDTPNAVWLNDEQKKKLGLTDKPVTVVKKQEKQTVSNNNRGSVGTDMQVSYYGAWAKDIALFLADKTGVKSVKEMEVLYSGCLALVGSVLKKHISGVIQESTPESEQVKNVKVEDETVDMGSNFDEPEDIDTVNLEEDTVKSSTDNIDDMDFSGLDDVDIG